MTVVHLLPRDSPFALQVNFFSGLSWVLVAITVFTSSGFKDTRKAEDGRYKAGTLEGAQMGVGSTYYNCFIASCP